MNIENLRKTIELLHTLDPEDFDMRRYREYRWGNDYSQHKCNSVGCILGHATILDTVDNHKKFITGEFDEEFDFYNWSINFYGLDDYSNKRDYWNYMFGSVWGWFNDGYDKKVSEILKSPLHAIYRIQNIIDGYIPPNFVTVSYYDMEAKKVEDYLIENNILENN